jgi:hypothetical protein
MNEDTRSEVEKFYDAVAAKFGVQRKYHEMQLVQAINMILQVVRDA